MKLTSKKALEMLEEIRKQGKSTGWTVEHSICVGNTAGKIAESLGLDVDKAKTLGYLHDIGKGVGEPHNHDINGYKYIKELGYDNEYANICLTHSYLNNDIYCTAGGFPEKIPFRVEFIKNHEYTIYEKINLVRSFAVRGLFLLLGKKTGIRAARPAHWWRIPPKRRR